MKKPVPFLIVYHADCIDGAASAWVVARAHPDAPTSYIPYAHYAKDTAEESIRRSLTPGTALYFVDCAPDKGFLDELLKDGTASSIHILDHHKSADEMLRGYAAPATTTPLELHIRPTSPSAAKMIWAKFFPNDRAPDVLSVIDMMDGDARGLTTPDSFAAAAFIDTQEIGTIGTALKTLEGLAQETFNAMAAKGKPVADYQRMKVSRMVHEALEVELQILPDTPAVRVPIINGSVHNFGRQVSDALVQLAQTSRAGAAFNWYLQKTGAVTMSIRTNGIPDASQIAAHLRATLGVTGGGHAGAAAVHFASLADFVRQIRITTVQVKKESKPPAPG